MRFLSLVLVWCALAFTQPSIGQPAQREEPDSGRLLVHLLGYIGLDYAGAVNEAGEVADPAEYREMAEFSKTALSLFEKEARLQSNLKLKQELESLSNLVLTKASPSLVAKQSQSIKNQVIEATGLAVSPRFWPDTHHGAEIFQAQCATCHGVNGNGDGPGGKGLNPPPSDFHSAKMDDASPFSAFNAIRLGVVGTAMVPFSDLSDRDVWDLAFYVISLRHELQNGSANAKPDLAGLNLLQVASQSDNELLGKISGSAGEKKQILSDIRLARPLGTQSSLDIARTKLQQVLLAAQSGQWEKAQLLSVEAYLDGLEPVEPELRSRDGALVTELERLFMSIRSSVSKRESVDQLRFKVSEAQAGIERAEKRMSEVPPSPWFTFWVSAGIFLREGFESVLVIITLLGVLRSLGVTTARAYVHAGWISAVLCGVIGWFFSGWLMQMSGASREVMEGTIAAFAVLVLLYFGFWLHQKTEIGKWRTFIQSSVSHVVNRKRLAMLGFVSFLAVFREAFETVLFLRALTLESGPSQHWFMLAGVLSAFVVVLILSYAMIRFSARLPLKQLFNLSSFVMIFLSWILVGKAIHAFQESGILSITEFPWDLQVDLLGLYPTYESLLPQAGLITLSVGVWAWSRIVASSSRVASAKT